MAKKLLTQQERIKKAFQMYERAKIQSDKMYEKIDQAYLGYESCKDIEEGALNVYLAELETMAAEVR